MPEKNSVSLRKHQQVDKTGRTMFVWVAIASMLISVSGVVSYSLYQRAEYNARVQKQLSETASNLENNNKIVEGLSNSIRERNTSAALVSTPRSGDAEPLTAILDALPAQPNSLALGASLEQKLLNVDGVTIESSEAAPVADDSAGDTTGDTAVSGDNTISFSFRVTASNMTAIRDVLRNLERSIRVMDLTTITVEQQGSSVTLSASGIAYYLPEAQVKLDKKTVPLKTTKTTAGAKK